MYPVEGRPQRLNWMKLLNLLGIEAAVALRVEQRGAALFCVEPRHDIGICRRRKTKTCGTADGPPTAPSLPKVGG
jgi:hypothetical protein